MRKALIAGIIASACLLLPITARANCDPLSLCSCSVSASGITFGNYDPLASSDTVATGSIDVSCTLTVALPGSYDIALSTGSSGSYSSRMMSNGSTNLNYNLYTSPSYTQVWGDGSGGSSKVNRSFSALLLMNQTTTVYGRIPALQNIAAGAYADTITVTITY